MNILVKFLSALAAMILTALPLPALATETYYIYADHLDTPRLITDGNQDIRWRWDNDDPFGGNIANANPSGLGTFEFNLRFPGQYFDKETNLHYNYFRDYSPEIGRYIESDPIGLRAGVNTYSYAGANPLSYIDPTGEISLPNDPSGLPSDWQRDPGHRDPNGERWRHPSGDVLDWHQGRPGMPGWRGKDHWHHNGGNEHLPPGTEVPDPSGSGNACGDDCKQKVATVVTTAGGVYILYRCIRMIPSLAPPLWWTIPGNLAAP